MLYIVTALYEEALPFIKMYCLKRKPDFPHFELFGGDGVLLLVTRPGALQQRSPPYSQHSRRTGTIFCFQSAVPAAHCQKHLGRRF